MNIQSGLKKLLFVLVSVAIGLGVVAVGSNMGVAQLAEQITQYGKDGMKNVMIENYEDLPESLKKTLTKEEFEFGKKESQKEITANIMSREIEQVDVNEVAYSKDKNGCGIKTATFAAMATLYEADEQPEDIVDVTMLQPFVDKIYNTIRSKGMEKALVDNLKEYEACLQKAEPHRNEEREIDMTLKHDGCSQLNKLVLDALDSRDRREKVSSFFARYENKIPNLKWTPYKDDNLWAYFVGQMFKVEEREDAVKLASQIMMRCVY
ncbi:MAG: hypothetical protein GC137_01320 [Alphaproteobacteria bacterium]|nr:hypothetical protein [Alphaproteobacteria bacterium]